MKMIDGGERVLAARLGETSAHVLLGHVLEDAGDVFDYMPVSINNCN
jgi:hypothetical protein